MSILNIFLKQSTYLSQKKYMWNVEKLEHTYIPDGNVKWCPEFGKQPGSALKY